MVGYQCSNLNMITRVTDPFLGCIPDLPYQIGHVGQDSSSSNVCQGTLSLADITEIIILMSPSLTHLPRNKMATILAVVDNIFKCIFLNENDRILIQISLKLFPRSPIDNKPTLVQVMA